MMLPKSEKLRETPTLLACLRRFALPLLCFGGLAMAQDSSTPTFHAESSLVLVPTLVTTTEGRVVFGLRDKDFVVLDNGVERTVQLDETFARQPVSMVIAVQRGGQAPVILGGGCPLPGTENIFTKKVGKCVSPMHGIAQMLETFLNDPGSQMALVSFDSNVRLRQKFTPDVDAVTKELETLPPGDGGSAILDTIQYSLEMLKRSPDGHRRVLVVISEEVDRGSSHISLEEAARQIASTNTEIYMIAMQNPESSGKQTMQMIARVLGPLLMSAGARPMGAGGGHGGMGGMHGGGMQDGIGPLTGAASTAASTAGRRSGNSGNSSTGDDDSKDQVMPLNRLETRFSLSKSGNQDNIPQTIADLTGGEYVLFSDTRGLDDALGLLNNHAHNRYLLSYRVSSSEPGMHRISVFTREPMGVKIAARTSYWLTAPAEHPAEGNVK